MVFLFIPLTLGVISEKDEQKRILRACEELLTYFRIGC